MLGSGGGDLATDTVNCVTPPPDMYGDGAGRATGVDLLTWRHTSILCYDVLRATSPKSEPPRRRKRSARGVYPFTKRESTCQANAPASSVDRSGDLNIQRAEGRAAGSVTDHQVPMRSCAASASISVKRAATPAGSERLFPALPDGLDDLLLLRARNEICPQSPSALRPSHRVPAPHPARVRMRPADYNLPPR